MSEHKLDNLGNMNRRVFLRWMGVGAGNIISDPTRESAAGPSTRKASARLILFPAKPCALRSPCGTVTPVIGMGRNR